MKLKRIFASVLAVASASVLLSASSLLAEEYNNKVLNLPYLPSEYSIKVDGKIDDIWYSIDPQPIDRMDDIGKNDVGGDYEDCDMTAQFRGCWTDHGFYLLVEVDKHGEKVFTDCVNPSYLEAYNSIDCVQVAFVDCIDAYGVHPSDSNIAGFNGGAMPNFDGDRNMAGWFYLYADNYLCQAVAKQTAEDKYVAEFYFDWVRPQDPKIYGPAGIGNGYVMTLDIMVHRQADDGTGGTAQGHKSVLCWNVYPYSWGNNANFGFFILNDDPEYTIEYDPSKVPAKDETPADVVDTGDETNADVTGDVTGDITGGKTDNGSKDNGKKDDKKDNSPATLDVASVVATASVLALGAALVIKKKHR